MTIMEHMGTLPATCPNWCPGDHERVLAEGASMEEARKHRSYVQDDVYLDEIRNASGQWVWREGGSSYDVSLVQGDAAALVEVAVTESHDDGHVFKRARIELTTGEARVLAAKLLWACDRADLES